MLKPYQQIPIVESGEPLVAIPLNLFSVEDPHPYEKLGAPYGDRSPYFLRESVLNRLLTAQTQLEQQQSGYRIQIFDAFRPIPVQQFMVDYTFAETLKNQGLSPQGLTAEQAELIWQQVYQFWAVPSPDPAKPPPHSTGAAVDITLVDEIGQAVDMGSAIDELSPRSYPDYFANQSDPGSQLFHQRRQLLQAVMQKAGFHQHPNEWWHFCYGDQMWAWLEQQRSGLPQTALYGDSELC